MIALTLGSRLRGRSIVASPPIPPRTVASRMMAWKFSPDEAHAHMFEQLLDRPAQLLPHNQAFRAIATRGREWSLHRPSPRSVGVEMKKRVLSLSAQLEKQHDLRRVFSFFWIYPGPKMHERDLPTACSHSADRQLIQEQDNYQATTRWSSCCQERSPCVTTPLC